MTPQARSSLSAPVLGQLLLMQSVMDSLPDKAAIMEFVRHGLPVLPGVERVEWLEEPQHPPAETARSYALQLAGSQHGIIVLHLSDSGAFLPYDPYLKNFCFMVAVLLEERKQRSMLEDQQARLEQRVRERTAELTRQIAKRERSQARLHEAQEIAQLCSWELEWADGTVRWSEGACRVLDIGAETLGTSRESFVALVHPEDRDRVLAAYAESAGSHTPLDLEFRLQFPGGRIKFLHERCRTTYADDGTPLRSLGTLQDITERRHLEEQLRQSQKLESLGRLAGGVAHDFNNLLTVINGYSELLLGAMSVEDPMHDAVAEVRKAGERASELTRQLLAFSRRQSVVPRPVDLNALLADSRDMFARVLGEDIDIETTLDPAAGLVWADPGQIHQVLMNLVVNARDAMPCGGRLEIRTLHQPGNETAPDDFVVLEVADTGQGMSEEVCKRAFEPFFTTKQEGSGTGLGLALVYGIVRQSGGWITVDSAVGRGARFRIGLPAAVDQSPLPGDEEPPRNRLDGHETILVVEDQPEVLRLAVAILRGFRYRTLEAATGPEAIELAASFDGPIHMMLTDVVMPRMSGPELAARIKTVRPGMGVLFMSGYTADVVSGQNKLDPGEEFIEKPFTPDALGKAVRSVLLRCGKRARILVLDDEHTVRSYFERILTQSGYQVTVAATPGEAIGALDQGQYELLLTDSFLPGEHGAASLKTLGAKHPALKILVVSGAFAGGQLPDPASLGVHACLSKPVGPEQLLDAVRGTIGG